MPAEEQLAKKRAMDRAYALKNRARKTELSRQWRDKNRDKVRASARKWDSKSREKRTAIAREWAKRNPDKKKAALLRWRAENKEYTMGANRDYKNRHKDKIAACARANALKRHYNLTVDDFAALIKRQGGVCAICGRDVRLGVDHCHDSGRVRGLLCRECNFGVGLFRDDRELLRRAITYLESASGKEESCA